MGLCKRKKTIKRQEEDQEIGRKCIWTALDTTTRLLVCFLVGDRTIEDARCFLSDLASQIEQLPLFVSDELPHYADGLMELFHTIINPEPTGRRGRSRAAQKVVNADLDYATVHKTRDKGRVVKVETKIVFGSLERFFKIMDSLPSKRSIPPMLNALALIGAFGMQHLTRRSITFAKSLEWLRAKFSICVAFYNLIRPHESLSRKEDKFTNTISCA